MSCSIFIKISFNEKFNITFSHSVWLDNRKVFSYTRSLDQTLWALLFCCSIKNQQLITVVNTKGFVPSVNQVFCEPVRYPINAVHVYKYYMKLDEVVSKSIVTQFHNSPDPRIITAEGFDFPVKVNLARLKQLCAGKCKGGLLDFHSVKVPAKSRTCHSVTNFFNFTIFWVFLYLIVFLWLTTIQNPIYETKNN